VAEVTQLGNDLTIRVVQISELKEQEVNAHVMAPATFNRLVENIKRRGALESLPYCAQPNGEGPVEIVSGHHRIRAARAAGLTEVTVLVDTSALTRSQIVAKQLAHNALVGTDDQDMVKRLLTTIDDPDDLIATGLPENMLGNKDDDQSLLLFTPRVDFDFKTVTFSFLPHQKQAFEDLCNTLDGRQDLLVACPMEQFEALLRAGTKYARIKKILSGGTAVALMIQNTLAEIERLEAEEAEEVTT
jgi:hypothetical protein